MLCYEADEMRWRYVLESDIWDLEPPQKEILPALELRLQTLAYKHLKRCFVALSLFPKGYLIDRSEVFGLAARLYFNEIVDRSFLQVHDIQGLHIMHDLIHDLACFLVADEFFRLEADDGCIEIPPNVRYLSIHCISREMSVASHSLRAIIVLNKASGYIENPEALLLGCEKLRALVFYEKEFFLSKALEGFMGSAKLLRHLHCECLLDNRYDISYYRLELHGIHSLINLHTLPQLYIGRLGKRNRGIKCKNIIVKCRGLPLAIKILGSMLRYESDEVRWRYVLESDIWDLEPPQKEILPALELSYRHLPIHLKRCFVALSLFPKGYLIDRSEVFGLWISLDIIQCDGHNSAARLYFNEIVDRSFLQVHDIKGLHIMHDLIHDLACFLAADEFFMLEADDGCIEIPPNVSTTQTLTTHAHSLL
uniref:Disease resistance protein winged helix domain-containing protein n=1 Tax=Oryza rufipogon TaxID=4529 RepID=A0A0E0R8M1_ORYRU